MNPASPNPLPDPHQDDLAEPLRSAVNEVRNDPVPEVAQRQSLDRARQLGATPRMGLRRAQRFLAAACLAAVLLVSAILLSQGGPTPVEQKGDTLARAERNAFGARKGASSPDPWAQKHQEELALEGKPTSGKYDDQKQFTRDSGPTNGGDSKSPDKNRPDVNIGLTGPSLRNPSRTEITTAPTAPSYTPSLKPTSGPKPTGPFGQPGPRPDEPSVAFPPRPRVEQSRQKESGRGEEKSGSGQGQAGERNNAPKPEPRATDTTSAQEDAERNLKRKDRGKNKDTEKTPSGKKGPQVWKRDRQKPTFARVYVGGGNSLELISLHVTVTIDGPRARTLVDHVFRNPHDRQLEGTFEYPLPTGASPSYFAMFLGQSRQTIPPRFARKGSAPALSENALAALPPNQLVKQVSTDDWGRLQEARLVAKEKALEVYEDIVRGNIDPALLEYAGGNTFRGRVFPIPRKGYNRVLIAYEETLPQTGAGRNVYRFPLPDCKLDELSLVLSASPAECKEPAFQPKKAAKSGGKTLLTYHHAWAGKGPGGDAVFSFAPPNPELQAISGRQNESGSHYLYARVRPELKTEEAKPFSEHGVFVLDASLSENPERFGLSVKLMRKILESDPGLKQFNVLLFNVGAAWLEPGGWMDNTPAGRDKALKRLDGLVLEGATDFGAALDKLSARLPGLAPGMPLDLFVLSDGQVTWGEADASTLVARFEGRCPYRTRVHCYRTGLGAENLALFFALSRRGGGVFNCFNEADLTAAAKAHRQQCWQINRVSFTGGPAARDVMVAGRRGAIYPGGELLVTGRFDGSGKTTLLVEGYFLGKKMVQEYPLEVTDGSELAPRAWAEVAVASLLSLNDPSLDGLVTAYCQQFGIGSQAASFLVLENDNDYKRLNLQDERGKAVSGDMRDYLENAWDRAARPASAREALGRFLARVNPRTRALEPQGGGHLGKLLALMADADFEVHAAALDGALTTKEDVPAAYLKALQTSRREVSPFTTEARRRQRAKDTVGAVRALSSIIEEHPGQGDALRLVGYRLLDLEQPAQAASLFDRVMRQRPFEPHSYRDLARALESCNRHALAAVHYEVVLAGQWHGRFGQALKTVVREEYARTLREALNRGLVKGTVAEFFKERVAQLNAGEPNADLRVTISWNTDATDVDLWVVEPDGTKCYYSNPRTSSGGQLSQDQTQGYGPERYTIRKAQGGEYRVLVHYFRPNRNLLAGESHVQVIITRFAGTPRETVERRTVILKKHDEAVEVTRIKF
jgi:Vault protein inter-alpha-trypsin domain